MVYWLKKYSDDEHLSYHILWSSKRGLPLANPKYMSPLGMVIGTDETGPLCIGFLVTTNANSGTIGQFMSNPDSDHEVRGQALDLLIQGLLELARQMNIGLITCATNNKRLIERWKRHGFETAEMGLTMMLREV